MEGSLASLATTLHDKFGITVKTVAFDSYKMMSKALSEGSIDVALPAYRDYWFAEQSGVMQSVSLGTMSLTAIHTGSNLKKDLQNIACTKSSFVNKNALESLFPTATVTEYQSDDEAFDALRKGTARCIVAPSSRVKTIGDRYDLEDCETVELPDTCDLACLMSRGKPELLGIINKGIINAGESLSASNYSSTSYTAQESNTLQFLYRNRTAIAATLIGMLSVGIVLLIWALVRARTERKKADAANAAKTAFLTRMSHDIRTPMNAIIGITTLMKNELHQPEKLAEHLGKLETSGQLLLGIINNILDMSRIESGKTTLNVEKMNLPQQVSQLDSIIRQQAGQRRQTFTVNTHLQHENVLADPNRLNQVLMNILSNAVKYTPKGGNIRLEVEELPRNEHFARYRFVVQDDGIGMSEEFQKTLFEPFTREEKSGTNKVQGTGLGMAITKSIVDLMGGTIHVESTTGKGTRFEVVLEFPIDAEADTVQEAQVLPEEEENASPLSGMKFLCAEDNAINAEILELLLESKGAHCKIYPNGQEIVDAFASVKPGEYDMILMDVQMPVMDGLEATRRIRNGENPLGRIIPILAMTANAFLEDMQKSKEAGMDVHLSKPVDIAALEQTVKHFRVTPPH